jgi:hypothetical protein
LFAAKLISSLVQILSEDYWKAIKLPFTADIYYSNLDDGNSVAPVTIIQ